MRITRAIVSVQDVDEVFREACASIVSATPHVISAQITVKGTLRCRAGGEDSGTLFGVPMRLQEDTAALLEIGVDDPAHVEQLAGIVEGFASLIELAWCHLVARGHFETLASTDSLTDLPNRRTLQRSLEAIHLRATLEGDPYAVVLFDLDRFTLINNAYGQLAGNAALCQIARAIEQMMPQSGIFGRWDGGAFLCILPGTSAAGALELAERLRSRISELVFDAAGVQFHASASFGIASFPEHGELEQSILGRTDMALFRAKRMGRDRIIVARADSHGLEYVGNRVAEALQTGGVCIALQPIVDLRSGVVVGEEVLARLNGTGHEELAAHDFMALAEDLNLAHRIDGAVMPQVFDRCAQRRSYGLECALDAMERGVSAADAPAEVARYMFVNLSPQLVRHPEDVYRLVDFCRNRCPHRVDCAGAPRPIVLEITERLAYEDTAQLKLGFQPLLEAGFQLAIDDFGSGFAPFVYLSELPISFIKIERFLVQRIHEPRARGIVQGICHIAKLMCATTIGEGVEDAETAAALLELGVDWGQGYHFGRPQIPTHTLG